MQIAWRAAACAALLTLASLAARADPNDYVLSPSVTEGEYELDLKFGSSSHGDDLDKASAVALGLGYGLTPHWYTEFVVQYSREGSAHLAFDTPEWENIFQVSEPGEWPIDLGIVTELEKPRDSSEGWKVRIGPLMQRELGRFEINLNLLLRRAFASPLDHLTRLDYQFQVKYRYRESFEYGLQALSDLGPLDPESKTYKQLHRAGPAVFGKIALGNRRALKYNAGVLFGTTNNSYDHTVRAQIEYEF